MNILLINHYAGSTQMGMEFRPYYFAQEWIKMGHKVTIIAGDYSHLRIKNPEVKKDFQKEVIDGVQYCWVKAGAYEGNGVKRALTMFRFVYKLWSNAGRIVNSLKPDVVITSSTYPLDTFAGQKIAKLCGARLIHEVHDMWPITPIEIGGMSKYHPFILILQFAENSFCKKADYVVSLLPNSRGYFIQHGMSPEKFVFISNGIALEEWSDKEELPLEVKDIIGKMKEKHHFLLCFFGSHTKSYALDYLIEAIKEFPQREIGLIFVGNGNEKENLQKQSQDCENIQFINPIPKKCIPALMDAIDGVYVGAINNKMFRFGICMNKLFDSMMGGKPILYAVNAPNNYIAQYQCGISVQAENVDALVEGLQLLLSKTEMQRKEMGENGKRAVVQYFNYKVLARKFESIFKE